MYFAYPFVFWLLPLVPLVWWAMHRRSRSDVATLRFSDLRAIAGVAPSALTFLTIWVGNA